MFASLVGAGAVTLVASRFASLATAATLAAAVGTAFGVGKLAFDSMAQRGLPRKVQGRLFARWETVFQLCWVSGAVIPVAVSLPSRGALALAGVGTLVVAGFYALDVGRIRRVREERAAGLVASPREAGGIGRA